MRKNVPIPSDQDTRYEVTLNYHKILPHVLYEMNINDLGFSQHGKIVFRFKQAEQFHEDLAKDLKKKAGIIPEFPKKNSVAFWNRTNNDRRKIEDRQRELEYYFIKILNDPILRANSLVKSLLKASLKEERKRNLSVQQLGKENSNKRRVSLPGRILAAIEKPIGKKMI